MGARFIVLACLFALASPALADPGFGTIVDQLCTSKGWVPAKPYNPNNLVTTDPKKVNCALCHTTAVPNKSGVNASGKQFLASGKKDVTPFCAPPVAVNHPPAFASVGAQQAMVAKLFQLTLTATDPDRDAIALSVSNSPAGATFVDNGNGSGRFSWTPGSAQTGNRTVTFHATDAGAPMASATLDVMISVGAVTNRPPVLMAIGDQRVDPGMTLALNFSATDPDGNTVRFNLQPRPAGSTLTGNQFRWTPSAAQSGSYPVTVTATDSGTPAANDSEALVITVGRVNRPPQLNPIGNRTVDLGQTGRIALVSSDPDADRIALSCSGLPSGAALTDLGDGTGEIVWAPTATGMYSVTCSATDNGLPQGVASETFMLSAHDPAPPPGSPALQEATWETDHGLGALRVRGDAADAEDVDIFALLSDGTAVKLAHRSAHDDGEFGGMVRPFIAPCQVAVASNGLMGGAMPVAGAPASCDAEALMTARAKSSCDGFTLKLKGRRAPPDAVITAIDTATGDLVYSETTTRGGSFGGRARVTSYIHALELRVQSAGRTWILPAAIPVSNACD
jgi:hypothetical protein